MPRAEISEFVHVVVIGIHFHVYLEIFEADMSYRFLIGKTIFRWVNLYGAPCRCQVMRQSPENDNFAGFCPDWKILPHKGAIGTEVSPGHWPDPRS